MALVIFAITLFTSAFLLFLVQPIIGKMILPKLGGTPQVWNTCQVFFQMALLAGYFYTHSSSSKLKLRKQLIAHAVLLLLPFAVLLPIPFNVTKWVPSLGGNPIPDTLILLATVVGLPFFVVATSAPLLQKWFGATGHPAAKDPYFLYGASNLGSMLALILYPIAVEPYLTLQNQAWLFAGGYCVLLAMVMLCAMLVWKPSGEPAYTEEPSPLVEVPPVPEPTKSASTAFQKGPKAPVKGPDPLAPKRDELSGWRKARWVFLAAVPVSFMLGVTTHITTDLSPIPLFWLVPLTLYLLSFILVFMKWPFDWIKVAHPIMLFIQPFIMAMMIYFEFCSLTNSMMDLLFTLSFNVLAFFATALVCHGELAKDRPSTKHLTVFYLLMSVGGMLGGMFNGLLAPVIFTTTPEFSIAIFLACIIRPKMKEEGWSDQLLSNILDKPAQQPMPKTKKDKAALAAAPPTESTVSYSSILDYVLPLFLLIYVVVSVFGLESMFMSMARSMSRDADGSGRQYAFTFLTFGLPLTIACFFLARNIRFGLAIGAILLIHGLHSSANDRSLFKSRSYFGAINVRQGYERIDNKDHAYRTLIHGRIDHGMNFVKPADEKDWGNPDKDFSRLATTYYHRYGPGGVVMEQYNWFPGKANTFSSDARMPAALVTQAVANLGTATIPTAELVNLWSEPPFATIGLGTGTMASYTRPYQHCHYYEIDNQVRRLSLPSAGGKTYFTYLKDAGDRGGIVQVLMGDARLRMGMDYKNFYADPNKKDINADSGKGGGPDNFYHMIVVDAFSSDAIPVHLITKEAIEMYFKKLSPHGILCVHISNRYVDLAKPVATVAAELGYAYRVESDNFDRRKRTGNMDEVGHYMSSWVLVARKAEDFKNLNPANLHPVTTEVDRNRYLWTDDHSNLVNVLRIRRD